MVKAMHEANIEVILDVVYNHTAEGNHLGPTLSFRGIDNASYYRLVDGDRAHYFDTTGTGNSLLMRSPHTLQMIMDSLRYWIEEMRVDGFRFDLASTLAREPARRGPALGLLRHRPAGPRDLPGRSSPSRGTWARAATRWAGSRRCGRSGTASTGTPSGASGAASPPRSGSSPAGSPAPPTCTSTPAAGRSPRSTSSPPTTGSPCGTWSPTTRSTTRPTARATPTGSRTTGPGTAGWRAPPTTRRSAGCARASSATSSPPCCSARACR